MKPKGFVGNRSFSRRLNRATAAARMISRPANQRRKDPVQSSMTQLLFLPVHAITKFHAPLARAVPEYSRARPFIPVSITSVKPAL